jgi:adenine-specific DNA-methyltransferase
LDAKLISLGSEGVSVLAHALMNIDAFQFLDDIAEGSVDMVVSSPPYFMGKEYDRSSRVEDFISDHVRILPKIVRVLKPGGSICWQVGSHVRDGIMIPLDALVYSAFSSPELFLRNRIVWSFGHGAHSQRRFSGRHETVLWYTKGAHYHFDLDAVRIPQKYPGKRHYKGPKKGEWSGNPLGKNPGDVWEIPNVNARHIEKTEHPCQFPVALIQRLVRALTAPGGTVVDPFMGSGSAGVAALIEGRNFLGCDISEKYVEIARARLGAAAGGKANIRPLDRPLYVPKVSEAVATTPSHFLAAQGRRVA